MPYLISHGQLVVQAEQSFLREDVAILSEPLPHNTSGVTMTSRKSHSI
jgi:hypothetical protein